MGAFSSFSFFTQSPPQVEELRRHVGPNIQLVLAANKADLLDVSSETLQQLNDSDRSRILQVVESGTNLLKQATSYAVEINAAIFKTSAKSGSGKFA